MPPFLKFPILRALLLVPLLASSIHAQPAPAAPGGDYLLVPGDVVHIQVFQEPDLDREVRISHDGEITLPLIGRVVVREYSLQQLEQELRTLYARDYLLNPQINATVVKFQVRSINVLGAVNAPQAVEYPPDKTLTLIDAISRAGGFNRLADRRRVRISRTGRDGQPANRVVDADQLLADSHAVPCPVQPDDVIFVPERVL